MENRIKEQQLDLFADRTSAATMRANQLRLWLSSVAYLLLHQLRGWALQGTDYAAAQCGTLRLRCPILGSGADQRSPGADLAGDRLSGRGDLPASLRGAA